jgi:hypothetical protein
MYAFLSVKISIKIDEVFVLENVDGTKNSPCLNSYFFYNILNDQSFGQFHFIKKKSTVTSFPCTFSSLLRLTLILMRFADWKMLMEPRVHHI